MAPIHYQGCYMKSSCDLKIGDPGNGGYNGAVFPLMKIPRSPWWKALDENLNM